MLDLRSRAALAVTLCLLLSGCGGGATAPAGPLVLRGAGATAPYPAYSKWIEGFKKEFPAIDVKYAATGSGDGLQQLQAGSVDFAASDIPLTDAQIAGMKVKPLHFPTLVGAIVPVYNVAGVGDLQFTGEALAGIFSGKITKWNHPSLASLNPGVALPAAAIAVIHRSDPSGSTFAFTEFLSSSSETWKKTPGSGAAIAWPVGRTAKGNEAVATLVKETANSIGYVELNYATAANLRYGSVKNAAGKFQKPIAEALGAALDAAHATKGDFRASLINGTSPNTYPIATLTWLIVPSQFADVNRMKAMKQFLRWSYGEGQKVAMATDFVLLQPPLLDRVRDQIGDIH